MTFREIFDVDILAASFFCCAPGKRIYSLVRDHCRVSFIHLAIIWHGAVVKLAASLDVQHELATRVPGIHQPTAKFKLLVVDG